MHNFRRRNDLLGPPPYAPCGCHALQIVPDHHTRSKTPSEFVVPSSGKTYRAAVQWSAKCHMAMEALGEHGRRGLLSTSVPLALVAMPGLHDLGSAPNTVVHRAGLAAAYGEDTVVPSSAGAHAGDDEDEDVVLVDVSLAEDNLKLTPVKGGATPAEQSKTPDKAGVLRGAVGPFRAFHAGPEYSAGFLGDCMCFYFLVARGDGGCGVYTLYRERLHHRHLCIWFLLRTGIAS